MGSLRSISVLVLFVLIVLGVAAIGSVATSRSVSTWYTELRKPSFNPPSWLFGPVWTVLYLTMAVAAWLVWRRHGLAGAALPLAIFAAQLILNAGWSILFFGLRHPGLALADIVALWLAILATIIAFWRVSPLAGALLLPYLAWVAFACILNWSIWSLNR